MDINTITPNLISDQERSEGNASPVAERVLNLSFRQSPNAEQVKLYFEKKGQQEQKYNELMQKSFKQMNSSPQIAIDLNQQCSFKLPGGGRSTEAIMEITQSSLTQGPPSQNRFDAATPSMSNVDLQVQAQDRKRVETKLLSIESRTESKFHEQHADGASEDERVSESHDDGAILAAKVAVATGTQD